MTDTPRQSEFIKPLPGEKSVSLPTAKLFSAPFTTSALVAITWFTSVRHYGLLDARDNVGCMVGIGVTGLIAFLSIFAISPWKIRPISLWASAWLGATVIRFLTTPIAAYLLYSASHVNAKALALSVAITYAACLGGEVWVLSLYLRRVA
ncbi:MAG TPA: hypothetical protein VG711_00215 [Phycisphaerales bacterium]|nr:hypothetical protein [Phycisphaerales bacterium]